MFVVGGIAPQQATRNSKQEGPYKGEVMNIENETILIAGANRGIGPALVNEGLRRGAAYKSFRGCGSGRRVTAARMPI